MNRYTTTPRRNKHSPITGCDLVRPPWDDLCDCVTIHVTVSKQRPRETCHGYKQRLHHALRSAYEHGAEWMYAADCELCDSGFRRPNAGDVAAAGKKSQENDHTTNESEAVATSDLVRLLWGGCPVWHFWNPHSGLVGGTLMGLLLIAFDRCVIPISTGWLIIAFVSWSIPYLATNWKPNAAISDSPTETSTEGEK